MITQFQGWNQPILKITSFKIVNSKAIVYSPGPSYKKNGFSPRCGLDPKFHYVVTYLNAKFSPQNRMSDLALVDVRAYKTLSKRSSQKYLQKKSNGRDELMQDDKTLLFYWKNGTSSQYNLFPEQLPANTIMSQSQVTKLCKFQQFQTRKPSSGNLGTNQLCSLSILFSISNYP